MASASNAQAGIGEHGNSGSFGQRLAERCRNCENQALSYEMLNDLGRAFLACDSPNRGGRQINPDLKPRAIGRNVHVFEIPKDSNHPSTLQLSTPVTHARQYCAESAFVEELGHEGPMSHTLTAITDIISMNYGGPDQQPNPDVVPVNETTEERTVRTFDQYLQGVMTTISAARDGSNNYDVNGPAEVATLQLLLRVMTDDLQQQAEQGHQESMIKALPSTGQATVNVRGQLRIIIELRTKLRNLKEALCTDIETLVAAGAAFTHGELLQASLAAEGRGRETRLLQAIDQGHLRRAASIENAIRAEITKQERATDPPLPK